jgi:hypothetical protein
MEKISPPYDLVAIDFSRSLMVSLRDHMYGINQDGYNDVLSRLNDMAGKQGRRLIVVYHQILPQWLMDRYPHLDIRFDGDLQFYMNFSFFVDTDVEASIDKVNFASTILGRSCKGKEFLCCALDAMGWLDLRYSLKNMSFDLDSVDGLIQETVGSDMEPYYHKKFIRHDRKQFYLDLQHGENYNRFSHTESLARVAGVIGSSFIHVIGETYATSSIAFVTEKLAYSAAIGQIFVAFAQPGWHSMINEYYGFKLYDEIIDYSFDKEENPVRRMDMLINVLEPLSRLSSKEWTAIYESTQEKRNYNRSLCVTNKLRDNLMKHSTLF